MKQELERRGICGRPDAQGKPGAVLSRGALYDMLRNPVYIGDIRHKEKVHKGQHDALLDKELWQRVQEMLDANGKRPRAKAEKKTEVCYLIGKVRDDSGDGMTPSHTIKKGRRYRYYISQRLTTGPDVTGWRLPARPLEQAVLQAVQFVLKDPVGLSRALASRGLTTT